MSTQSVIKSINSNPRLAMSALSKLYHNRTYVVTTGNKIIGFFKTKKGAEGYNNRLTQDITDKIQITEVHVTDIIDPIYNIRPWYTHIKNMYTVRWYMRSILEMAAEFEIAPEVMKYVKKAVNEAITDQSFTPIAKYEISPRF